MNLKNTTIGPTPLETTPRMPTSSDDTNTAVSGGTATEPGTMETAASGTTETDMNTTGEETTAGNGPGFAVAVCALIGTVLLARRYN